MTRPVPRWRHREGPRAPVHNVSGYGLGNAVDSTRMDASLHTPSNPVLAGRKLALDVRGVSLVFDTSDGQVRALSNINLQIGKGDFVSLIGPSGCGKTT